MEENEKKPYNATIRFKNKRDWEIFKKLCEKNDTSASREIRRMIEDYKEQHKEKLEKLF